MKVAAIVWGLVTRGWYMTEIGAVFLACGLVSGAVAKMGPSRIAEHFVDGCKDFVYAAFVIGLTRGILVIAEQGMIIDPILHGLNEMLTGVPTYALTSLALLAHNVITFFVPSSSGEAALTMPVLAPLVVYSGVLVISGSKASAFAALTGSPNLALEGAWLPRMA